MGGKPALEALNQPAGGQRRFGDCGKTGFGQRPIRSGARPRSGIGIQHSGERDHSRRSGGIAETGRTSHAGEEV